MILSTQIKIMNIPITFYCTILSTFAVKWQHLHTFFVKFISQQACFNSELSESRCATEQSVVCRDTVTAESWSSTWKRQVILLRFNS